MFRDELEKAGAHLSDVAALRPRTDVRKPHGGLRGLQGPLDPAVVALRALQGRSAPTSNLTLPAAANGSANLLGSSLWRGNPALATDLHRVEEGTKEGAKVAAKESAKESASRRAWPMLCASLLRQDARTSRRAGAAEASRRPRNLDARPCHDQIDGSAHAGSRARAG
jgi:hypothetical protein